MYTKINPYVCTVETITTALDIGDTVKFQLKEFELKEIYVNGTNSTLYQFVSGKSFLWIRVNINGTVEMTHTDYENLKFDLYGYLAPLNGISVKYIVKDGELCRFEEKEVLDYDPVRIGQTLEYHSNKGVKSLTVIAIGKDGTLVCESHKGETTLVRKGDKNLAACYNIGWNE